MNEIDRYTDPPKRQMTAGVAFAWMAVIIGAPVVAFLWAWFQT